MSRTVWRLSMAVAALGLLALLLWWAPGAQRMPSPRATPVAGASADRVAKGAYLARAGNCELCHTQRGGAAFAGGRAIETPFGTVYSSNLTPDVSTGIGSWTSVDFWRALHDGRSRDGRLLYPVFPYVNFTLLTQDDADALFAYLKSLSAVAQANRAHQLRWPYDSQIALAAWRALYFKPGTYPAQRAHDAQWNRGAYLVRGLGHCNACHTTRNLLGAADDSQDLAGGPMPMKNWYAPSLLLRSEAGLGDWELPQIVRLLQTGVSQRASVLGPMAEVVLHSTQYLSSDDLTAIAVYLKSQASAAPDTPAADRAKQSAAGAKLYEKHCAECHGTDGQGVPGAYPALAGNRAVQMRNAANLVQVVLQGGFAPATRGNPRPYGMPPYQLVLDDGAVAAVLTHIRGAWGNGAGEVSEMDVSRYRSSTTR